MNFGCVCGGTVEISLLLVILGILGWRKVKKNHKKS